MNWRDIVAGVRAGNLRLEYYFPTGKKTGRYRLVKLVTTGGYTDWRPVRIGAAAIYRAMRELYPATHGASAA